MRFLKDIFVYSFRMTAIVVCILLSACTVDPDTSEGKPLKKGEASIKGEIVFEPMRSALTADGTRTTNAPKGKAIGDIEDLCILFYDTDGNLIENGIREIKNPVTDSVKRNGNNVAESYTRHASFSIEDIPYGKYYMFAVANLGKKPTKLFPQATTTYDELTVRYKDDVRTMTGLKSIELTWDAENLNNNAEMLGYFTVGALGTPAGLENAAPVTIDRDNMSLHSWLRRAASKVTIEFDPSGLRDNIRIYLKRARLRHIPLHCPLGDKNTPSTTNDLIPEEGETEDSYYHIDYFPEGTESDPGQWMVLAKGGILDGADNTPLKQYDGMHDETARALYFYENMQGKGKDKSQDADGNGELDYPGKNTNPADEGYKDRKPYGTYVEIEAQYVSNAQGNYGKGKIFYRFMLGKNEIDDYNAERNHHYKLTMRFHGNANDVDWHIDYTPESDILYAPDPYYISYMYGQSMNLPLFISGNIKPGDQIIAKIVENGWGPADDAVRNQMYNNVILDKSVEDPYSGFLSLVPITNPVFDPNGTREKNQIKNHWPDISTRTIGYNELKDNIEKNGAVNLPLYTREKQIVPTTGFTGNNIYPQYMRKAVIEISGTIGGVRVGAKRIRIMQVRRIINPSGVFRKHDNDAAFKIIMSYRGSETATKFQPLHSMGPWEAVMDNNGSGWEIVDATDGKVSGADGSEISFSVKPVQTIAADEVRCAIVNVYYNNKTCHHRIILRQGDEPIAIADGGSKWYYYNLRSKNELVDQPMDEGSMFRFGNIDQPISSENQTPESIGKDRGNTDFKIEGGTPSKWNLIGSKTTAAELITGFSDQTILNGEARIAESKDFTLLQNAAEIDYKYGILYGNDATTTQMDAKMAYGYNKYFNSNTANGMRGCFVFNHNNCRSIFLPVGNTGMGRIKGSATNSSNNEYGRTAVLRYANRSPENTWPDPTHAPLFLNLYSSQGALYWFNKEENKATSWDINFRTFDFNSFGNNAITDNGAAFLRCVVKE